MSCVSYARDFYGSYARNLVREFLSRLFNGATPGVCLRIAPDENIDSLASDLLQEAGWSVASRSEDVTEGEIQLVLVEPGNCGAASDDPGNVADVAALVAARRPWVVLVNTKRQPLSALEQRLSSVGFFFVWFDETYRYYLAAERTALLMPAFMEQLPLEKLTPPYVFSAERIAMTLGCRDCDDIPKVPDAGRVIEIVGGERIQVMHNGIRVVADGYGGSWTTDLIARCRGHHEPQEERVFHEVLARLPAGATMVEIGGYWAYYSLWFMSGGDDRRSIVMEPDPAHLDIGRRNAALNGLSPEFVAGFAGTTPGWQASFQTEDSGLVALPCLTVPQLLSERTMERLDVLHCDSQGAEIAVLEGCAELLRRGVIRWVFISTHAHQITSDPLTHQRCLALVRGLGGKLVAEHDVHESFSGDGLIVAWFGPGEPDPPMVNISRNRYGTSMFRNPLYDMTAERSDAARLHTAAERKEAEAGVRVMEAEGKVAAAEVRAAKAEAEAARAKVLAKEAEAAAAAAETRIREVESTRIDAEALQAAAETRAAKTDARLIHAEAAYDVALAEIQALRDSTSWRMTAPLRFVSHVLRSRH